jgi:hypothetical protein
MMKPGQLIILDPRGREYVRLVGRRIFRTRNTEPIDSFILGRAKAVPCILIDTRHLEPAEFDSLREYLAGQYGVKGNIVETQMREFGIPIPAEECELLTTAGVSA